MARFFKKRHKAPETPKNVLKVMRRQEQGRGSHLEDLFPTAGLLKIQLKFVSPQGHVVGEETRVFKPESVCDFSAACPGNCGTGQFNLEGKVREVVEGALPSSESSGKCPVPRYGGTEPCGVELKCRIEATFRAAPAPPPPPPQPEPEPEPGV